ncbi:hypothetical protein AC625_23190 [Peribacillus loiseleuriae]|uniref:Uncharacterized protein n=1 Tax=Peribacillus loiseleuriae TaxID=1679170 RepID=A0A0K9GZM6_9BACI|nr:hypothetical protein AC625_23190 [Peribacillus loiseleuriae]
MNSTCILYESFSHNWPFRRNQYAQDLKRQIISGMGSSHDKNDMVPSVDKNDPRNKDGVKYNIPDPEIYIEYYESSFLAH